MHFSHLFSSFRWNCLNKPKTSTCVCVEDIYFAALSKYDPVCASFVQILKGNQVLFVEEWSVQWNGRKVFVCGAVAPVSALLLLLLWTNDQAQLIFIVLIWNEWNKTKRDERWKRWRWRGKSERTLLQKWPTTTMGRFYLMQPRRTRLLRQ